MKTTKKTYQLYQIDAFTKTPFTGNPAGVVTNADGLSDNQMQQIARELNNSETAFIFSGGEGYDVHVRYFTPTTEVPICGHATIAAHYARALEMGLGSTRVYSKTGAGVLPVDLVEMGETCEDYTIVMTQGEVVMGPMLDESSKHTLLTALGLTTGDLLSQHPVQIASTGHSKVMIGLSELSKLHALTPNLTLLKQLSQEISCNGYYVYTLELENKGEQPVVHGRMFAPAIGIAEDPVTGNANGPLGAYLVHHQLVDHDGKCFKFKAVQGEAMGRPGTMEVEVEIANGQPSHVRILGQAVVVFKTELSL